MYRTSPEHFPDLHLSYAFPPEEKASFIRGPILLPSLDLVFEYDREHRQSKYADGCLVHPPHLSFLDTIPAC